MAASGSREAFDSKSFEVTNRFSNFSLARNSQVNSKVNSSFRNNRDICRVNGNNSYLFQFRLLGRLLFSSFESHEKMDVTSKMKLFCIVLNDFK